MKLFVLGILLLIAPSLQAQTVINPTAIEFNASSNHNAVDALDLPIVVSYEYVAIGMNGNGAIVVTVNIGKPAVPDGGLVTMPIPGFAQLTVNAFYTATLEALGQQGTRSGKSVPSNPFAVAGPATVPAKPTNVKLKP